MQKKYDLNELALIRNTWPDTPVEAVPESCREVFRMRKMAVDLYIDGARMTEIEGITKIARQNILRLVERCCSQTDTGSYYGYTALFPYNVLASNKDSKSGLFQKLLQKYPEAEEYLKGCYFGDKKYTTERVMNKKTLHEKFLAKLIDLGAETYEYPFNTKKRGYQSLCLYVDKLASQNINEASNRLLKDEQQKITSTGIGTRFTYPSISPFSVVQVDGHRIDIEYYVEIENIDGTISKSVAIRPWLFAVIDVSTRCILGYSVTQSENYSQYDVIDAIQDAMLPRKKKTFFRIKSTYPDNGGFHSLAYPQLSYSMVDTIQLDNAKSHLARNTVNRLTERLGITLNFGSVATPEARGIVERFFGTLETRGFHRLPMTTGSNPRDPKRRDAEKQCIKYDMTYDDTCEILELIIAEYNDTPHSSLQNLTPLECMRRRVFDSGMMPVIATGRLRSSIDNLHYISDTRVVRGGKTGKRAYVNYNGAVYRNETLAVTNDYVGQKIYLEIDPHDISSIDAYTSDGIYLGELHACGEFGAKSHSLKTRKEALKSARERGYETNSPFSSPISVFEQELVSRARKGKSRRSATKVDQVRREQRKPKPSDKTAEPAEIVRMTVDTSSLPPREVVDEIRKLPPAERVKALFPAIGGVKNDPC